MEKREGGAMTGQWLFRNADRHTCELPALDPQTRTGDVWKCGKCGLMHVVLEHQHDGFYFAPMTPSQRVRLVELGVLPEEAAS